MQRQSERWIMAPKYHRFYRFGSYVISIEHSPIIKPWKPSIFFRLRHPFTWRKTQVAALALMPKEPEGDISQATYPAWNPGAGQVTGFTIINAGSGYSTPPAVAFTPPGSTHHL
jgi:hypothetical protein